MVRGVLAPLALASCVLAVAEEELVQPAAPTRPHIVFLLVDDFGWANAGWCAPTLPRSVPPQPHRPTVPRHPAARRCADGPWYMGHPRHRGSDMANEVQTPAMDELVRTGIELDRHYVYQFCPSPTTPTPVPQPVRWLTRRRAGSPTRCALQTGRNPLQVNPLNAEPNVANPADPVGGFAGIARNFTGIATKMAAAGFRTHFVGKWGKFPCGRAVACGD